MSVCPPPVSSAAAPVARVPGDLLPRGHLRRLLFSGWPPRLQLRCGDGRSSSASIDPERTCTPTLSQDTQLQHGRPAQPPPPLCSSILGSSLPHPDVLLPPPRRRPSPHTNVLPHRDPPTLTDLAAMALPALGSLSSHPMLQFVSEGSEVCCS